MVATLWTRQVTNRASERPRGQRSVENHGAALGRVRRHDGEEVHRREEEDLYGGTLGTTQPAVIEDEHVEAPVEVGKGLASLDRGVRIEKGVDWTGPERPVRSDDSKTFFIELHLDPSVLVHVVVDHQRAYRHPCPAEPHERRARRKIPDLEGEGAGERTRQDRRQLGLQSLFGPGRGPKDAEVGGANRRLTRSAAEEPAYLQVGFSPVGPVHQPVTTCAQEEEEEKRPAQLHSESQTPPSCYKREEKGRPRCGRLEAQGQAP